MKRQLEGKEKQTMERQLERRKSELKQTEGNLEYNTALIDRQRIIREFDDKWRNFLREQKTYEDKLVVEQVKQSVEDLTEMVSTMETQLTEGVELPKTMTE